MHDVLVGAVWTPTPSPDEDSTSHIMDMIPPHLGKTDPPTGSHLLRSTTSVQRRNSLLHHTSFPELYTFCHL